MPSTTAAWDLMTSYQNAGEIKAEVCLGLFSFAHLFSALETAHCADERIARAPQRTRVASGVQAEPVQDAGEEADVIPHLRSVPELQQSRQVPQTRC